MKFDITQQSPFISLVTLFFISVVGVFALVGIDPVGVDTVVGGSLLDGFGVEFQRTCPVGSAIIASGLIVSSSIWLGYIISMQNLYGVSTSIQLFVICALLWCATLGESYLLPAIVAALSVQVVGSLLRSVRSNNYSGYILNASLSLSLLPALYAPSVVMLLFLPIFWIIIGVTLRELIVSLVGALLPFGWVVYLFWLCGHDFMATLSDFGSMVMTPMGLFEIGDLPLFQTVIVAISLLISLLSLLFISGANPHIRRRFMIVTVLGISSLLSIVVPSATLLSVALAAPALALLTSLGLVQLRGVATNTLYFVYLVLLVASMFIPLYLHLEPLGLHL